MFTLPDLPYPYNALEPHIDEKTMQIHHDKHHGAYVKNLNDALTGQDALISMDVYDLMKNLSKVPEAARMKVRNNGGGHANHSFFWIIMSPGGGRSPSGELARAIDRDFGSFAGFTEKFASSGMGRFGSGWVWLQSEKGKLSINDTPNQDNPWMEGKTPILGLDVWEHAYYLKYQNLRADYIKAWWNVVNWKEVGRLFSQSS